MPGKKRSNAVFTVSSFCLFLGAALTHKCYICGVDDVAPSCDNFDPNNSIFTKECSRSSAGCSIQKHDGAVVRACEDYKLNDCKIANDVEYCYCSANLCNADMAQLFRLDLSDDEDVAEGSGSTTTSIPKDKAPPEGEVTKVPPSVSTGNSLQSTYILIIASFMFN